MLNILNWLLMGTKHLIHNVNEYLIDSSENDRNLLFFILDELHSFLYLFLCSSPTSNSILDSGKTECAFAYAFRIPHSRVSRTAMMINMKYFNICPVS